MSIVQKYIDHLEGLDSKVDQWAIDAIIENAEIIIKVLQEVQLDKGLDSYGNIVGRYFWKTEYIFAKDPQNKPRKPKITGEPYNFDWSGEFFETMSIRAKSNKTYDIFSTTGKDKFLEGYFKTELTTFTEENNKWVNENIILPYVYKKLFENMFKI